MSQKTVKTERTSTGLRNTLFDTLDLFLNGKIDAVQAKTTAKLADSLLKSIALDMEHKRLVQQMITEKGPEKALSDMNLNIVMGNLIEHKAD